MTADLLLAVLVVAGGSRHLATAPCSSPPTQVIVLTQHHVLLLCENGQPVARFWVALGSGGIGKRSQGDRKTPLGTYSLGEPRPSTRFGTFIPFDYPTAGQRFQGFTGRNVGIHGPDRRLQWAGRANTRLDWTAGCIALSSDQEVEKVASWVKEKGATLSIR
jgi:murein L,D-transpeptidase YafK